MKRAVILLAICFCLLFTGCNNSFAAQEYNSAEKIAQPADRYAKERAVFNTVQGGYSFEAGKFNGRETLWSVLVDKDEDLEIELFFSLTSGKAKLVHIDDEGNLTTVIECSPETSTDGYVTRTLSLKEGQNRLKLVGYGCENIDLKMLSENF